MILRYFGCVANTLSGNIITTNWFLRQNRFLVDTVHLRGVTTMELLQTMTKMLEKQSKVSALEKTNADYYKFGELTYLALTISWYMTNKEYQKIFRDNHAILQKEFVSLADSLGVARPVRKAGENENQYMINYYTHLVFKLEKYSILTVCFHVGFKVMAVKLMEFTQKKDNMREPVDDLMNYLHAIGNPAFPLSIKIKCADKVGGALNVQLDKPAKNFVSTFDKLKEELKTELFSINRVAEVKKEQNIVLGSDAQKPNLSPSPSSIPSADAIKSQSLWIKPSAISSVVDTESKTAGKEEKSGANEHTVGVLSPAQPNPGF